MTDKPAHADSLVTLAISDGVAEVTLDRSAKRNALSRALIAQLAAAVAHVAADASTRLVVLSANGPAFCAGMDLDEMQNRSQQPNAGAEWEQDASDYRDLVVAILRLDVPTLAVVQGPAIAGGFGLVLACDLVLASTAARFALPEPKRGISPAVVSPLLVYRMGAGPAMPMLLAGQTLTGEEAHRLGLCHVLACAGERRNVAAGIGDVDPDRRAAGAGDDQAAGAKFLASRHSSSSSRRDEGLGRGAATTEAREGWLRSWKNASRAGISSVGRGPFEVIQHHDGASLARPDSGPTCRPRERGQGVGQLDPRVEPLGHPQGDLAQPLGLVLRDFAQPFGQRDGDPPQTRDFVLERRPARPAGRATRIRVQASKGPYCNNP